MRCQRRYESVKNRDAGPFQILHSGSHHFVTSDHVEIHSVLADPGPERPGSFGEDGLPREDPTRVWASGNGGARALNLDAMVGCDGQPLTQWSPPQPVARLAFGMGFVCGRGS